MEQNLQEYLVLCVGIGVGFWIVLGITRTFFGNKILHTLLQRGHVRLAMRLRGVLTPNHHD